LRELAKLGIVHADIKPENLLTEDGSFGRTKVADFGTSCYAEEQIFSYIQSRFYRAPEVLYGLRYGPAIDMWSLGCVVYELLIGEPLFAAEDGNELAEMIEVAVGPPPSEIYRNGTKWNAFERIGPEADRGTIQPLSLQLASLPRAISRFVRGCIVWDPDERLTPEQALVTDWILPEWELMKRAQEARHAHVGVRLSGNSQKPAWHN
jgi:dual specificity tyrosine-phosphorylation-regulated kinase 2/3/4